MHAEEEEFSAGLSLSLRLSNSAARPTSPALSHSRSPSPERGRNNEVAEERTAREAERDAAPAVSTTDLAYRQALVHPLDDRFTDDSLWRSAASSLDKQRITLQQLNEIPTVLAKDFDMLMVAASMRSERHFDRVQDQVLSGKKTVSPRRQRRQLMQSLSRRGLSLSAQIETEREIDESLPFLGIAAKPNSRPSSAVKTKATAKSKTRPKTATGTRSKSIEDTPQLFIHTLQDRRPRTASAQPASSSHTHTHSPALARGISSSNPTLRQILARSEKLARPQSAHSTMSVEAQKVNPQHQPTYVFSLASSAKHTTQNTHNAHDTDNVHTHQSLARAMSVTRLTRAPSLLRHSPSFFDDERDLDASKDHPSAPDVTSLFPRHPGVQRGVLSGNRSSKGHQSKI